MRTRARPLRFLLVEDDDNHADLVRRAMAEERIGNELDRVADGEEAMAWLRREVPHEAAPRPDIILLDLKLPRLDGHEVLRNIKSNDDLKHIPVVVMTTSRAESDRIRAYNEHANSYVVKPLDFGQMHELVKELGLYWTVWNEPL